MKNEKNQYEIVKRNRHCLRATAATQKEINLISWNGREPKNIHPQLFPEP